MQLLVSVAGAADVPEALAGGADIIDAKDPSAGALGAVSLRVLREIHAAVGGRRPLTAALGDAASESDIERLARDFAAAGAALVKVGFAGVTSAEHAARLARAAVLGAGEACGVVVVAYADAERVNGLPREQLIDVAIAAGARGVLIDTADKTGPGLIDLVAPSVLGAWVAEAHAAGLLVALAGRLRAEDLVAVRESRADVAGVRGAACEGGRGGRIVASKVQALKRLCEATSAPSSAASSTIVGRVEGVLQ
jgi:uncharacterized protein (UPF0264 family)